MTTIYVQFSDSTETMVIGYAVNPQSVATWPNQGDIDTSDARWHAYFSSKATPDAQMGLPAPD
jgi:hypothetical protein